MTYVKRRWTAEEDEFLRNAWARGDSHAVIGAALGRTRGSVVGEVQRLRLRRRFKQAAVMAGLRLPPNIFDAACADAQNAHITLSKHLQNIIVQNYKGKE